MNRRGFFGMIAALFVAKPAIQAALPSPYLWPGPAPDLDVASLELALAEWETMMLEARYPLRIYTPVKQYGMGFQVSKKMLEDDFFPMITSRCPLT